MELWLPSLAAHELRVYIAAIADRIYRSLLGSVQVVVQLKLQDKIYSISKQQPNPSITRFAWDYK